MNWRSITKTDRIFIGGALFSVLVLCAFLLSIFSYNNKAQAQTTLAKNINVSGIGLSGINVDKSQDLYIYSDNPIISPRFFSLSSPNSRIVIDLNRVNWVISGQEYGTLIGKNFVNQIRFAHKSSTESRIVLDLKTAVKVVAVNNSKNGKLYATVIKLKEVNQQVFNQQVASNEQAVKIPNTLPSPISPKYANKKYTIIVDAGHGGHDPGASGFVKGTFEKNINLAAAKYLQSILVKDPRFNVIMTRDDDTYLTLSQRIIIARERRADLFISLHADAAPIGQNAEGATVYTLSEEGGQRSRRLLNNSDWTVAPTNRTQDNNVVDILRDLTQRDTKNQSAVFAENIISYIKGVGPLTSSSHRRADFFVLLSPSTPAVLFEMGFVTDKEDEERLLNSNFRAGQMGGVAKAIIKYFDEIDAKNR